jgi:hypothetical protein
MPRVAVLGLVTGSLAACAFAPPALAARHLLGHSRAGRPIYAYETGNRDGNKVLVDDSEGSIMLERAFARLVHLPLARLTDYPGSVTTWENHRFAQATAFVVELPPGSLTPADVGRYARAVLAVAGNRSASLGAVR